MARQFALVPDLAFVNDLLEPGEGYRPQVGDTVEAEDLGVAGVVVEATDATVRLRDADGTEHDVEADAWFQIEASPAITAIWERHLQTRTPDGVAFADDAVPAELHARLNAQIQRLADEQPADFHPGSGERVRDLVHPSLYPYVAASPPSGPEFDRFGRAFEGSRYQWLPTPFRVAPDGSVRAQAYLNNLDGERYPELVGALEALFGAALPLVESVLGYVASTAFWREGGDSDESELPQGEPPRVVPAVCAPSSVRGRELLVIPKIVEYTLRAGETHEGVWHVEGMSHEHIVATCVFVADRDDALLGGDLHFKRAYTRDEAGRLFWNIDQSRPRPVEDLVAEGTIPLGAVATPRGRLLVFPNSHIHQLRALTVAPGAEVARRRVVVFWIVDPDVTIPSTRDVQPQQGVLPRAQALAIRLALMDERKRHKQTLNVRAVSLCEH